MYHFVTSLNTRIWNKFAHKTVGTFMDEYREKSETGFEFLFWFDKEQEIHEFASDKEFPQWYKFTSLDRLPQYVDFERRFGNNVPFNERGIDPSKIVDGAKFRFNYIPFAKKVYSWVFSYLQIPQNDYLVWFDADIILKQRLTPEVMEKMIQDFDICFLDRDFPWYSAETGFFVIKRTPLTDAFVQLVLQIYHSGFLFDMSEWHDGFVFKTALKLVNSPELRVLNWNPVTKERDVFERTMLADFMEHYKGGRKQELNPNTGQQVNQQPTLIEFDPEDQ